MNDILFFIEIITERNIYEYYSKHYECISRLSFTVQLYRCEQSDLILLSQVKIFSSPYINKNLKKIICYKKIIKKISSVS